MTVFSLLFFLAFVLVSVETQKYKCFGRSIYVRNCKVYNYSAENCFKWDVSRCPTPDVRHQETHCIVYSCEEIQYKSPSQKVTHLAFVSCNFIIFFSRRAVLSTTKT